MLTRFRTAVFHLVLWMKLGCSQQPIRIIDQNQPMRSQSKDKQINWGAGNWRQWTSCRYFRCLAGHTVAFTYHLPSQNFMKKSSICQKNPTCKSLPWGKDTADWNILLAAICSITSVTVGCCSRDGPRLLETWWWRAAAGPQRKGLSRKGCLK